MQGYKDSIALGYPLNFADPLCYASLGVTVAYSVNGDLPDDERAHFEVKGRYLDWWGSLVVEPRPTSTTCSGR